MRRILVVVTAVMAVLVVTPGAAMATVSGNMSSPAADGTVTDSAPVEVTVNADCFQSCNEGRLDDDVRGVEVELRSGNEPVGSVNLECVANCRSEQQRWGARTLGDLGAPAVCNGGYALHSRVTYVPSTSLSGEPETTPWQSRNITLSAPPSAPSDLNVSTGIETASVKWSEVTAFDDLKGYAVERKVGNGSWEGVELIARGTHSYADSEVPSGNVQYRVSSLRADGFADDGRTKPATPCEDDSGPTLSSAHNPDRNLRYAAASGTVQAAPSPNQGSGGESGGGGSGDGSGGGAQGPNANGSVDAPPAPRADSSPNDADEDSPDLPGVGAPPAPSGQEPESFYGEDFNFNEQLDYGNQDPVAPPTNPDDEVVIDRDLAAGEGVGRFLDFERMAVPFAVGLLLIALGLHLRRWMNVPVPAGAGEGTDEMDGGPPQED